MRAGSSGRFDVIVVGGGAAGLLASISAARRGRNVLLLEKNAKLGVKILMSGGTRCNITHDCNAQGIVEAFGISGRFLHSPLAALSPGDVVRLIESAGVATKVETGGKVFPVSNRAVDVRDALVRLAVQPRLGDGRVSILSATSCDNIGRGADGLDVTTNTGRFTAQSVVITTGGKSYPGCGTTGDGYAWASHFGHQIVKPVPALTPLVSRSSTTHGLKGITLDDVQVAVVAPQQAARQIATIEIADKVFGNRGGFLFTHFGFSGPAVLNVSRLVSWHSGTGPLALRCDFKPGVHFDQFRVFLRDRWLANPKQSLIASLAPEFPRRFVEWLLNDLGIPISINCSEISNDRLHRIVGALKGSEFPIRDVYGFAKAEVTAGGVDLDEVDSRTMQSKLCPGLYFAGEILDLDGPIGGYNFQAAFSTGWLAGMHA